MIYWSTQEVKKSIFI
jgi:hypothetical protein